MPVGTPRKYYTEKSSDVIASEFFIGFNIRE